MVTTMQRRSSWNDLLLLDVPITGKSLVKALRTGGWNIIFHDIDTGGYSLDGNMNMLAPSKWENTACAMADFLAAAVHDQGDQTASSL